MITANEFKNEVENKNGVVVVDFFATWCGPCKMLAPIFTALGEEMGEQATFLKVDVDQSMALAQRFKIASVPTTILFKDGQEVERLSGFMAKDILKTKVEQYL